MKISTVGADDEVQGTLISGRKPGTGIPINGQGGSAPGRLGSQSMRPSSIQGASLQGIRIGNAPRMASFPMEGTSPSLGSVVSLDSARTNGKSLREVGAIPVHVSRRPVVGRGLKELEQDLPHGKDVLTREQATDLLGILDGIIAPVDKAIADREDIECTREIESGPYPLILKVRERLAAQLKDPTITEFQVSQGEWTVLEKGASCAGEVESVRFVRSAVSVGVGLGAVGLLFLVI